MAINNPILDRPQPTEVELSFFGPSYGESVLIHAGFNNWYVVDSCWFAGTKVPRAVHYLKTIGIDPGTAVKGIVVTHWDDDHIRGMAETFRAAPTADLVISGAIYGEEFFSLLEVYSSPKIVGISGISALSEMSTIIRDLEAQGRPPTLAIANKQLVDFSPNPGFSIRLTSLSPSEQMVLGGTLQIGKVLNSVLDNRIHVVDPIQNHRSVVLWLEVGSLTALLGSDLQEVNNLNTGWSAIVQGTIRRSGAQVFKVPHHGSKTGHLDQVWKQLLVSKPLAAIVPWRVGARTLPTREDVARVTANAGRLFVTAIPQKRRKQRRRDIAAMINATARDLVKLDQVNGHIRLRADASVSSPIWKADLFNGAREITRSLTRAFPNN